MSVPVSVVLDDEATKRFARLKGRFANWKPVMRGPVRRLIRSAIVKQFATRGRFGGEPWPELAESTQRIRRLAGYGPRRPILRRTDRLYHSLIRFSHPDRQEEFTEKGYVLRTLVPYARYHGSDEPRYVIPKRAPIPETLPADFLRQLRNVIRGYLIKGELA